MKHSVKLLFPLMMLSAHPLVGAEDAAAAAWWDKAWSTRQPVTLNAGADGAGLEGETGGTAVLVRLSDANFGFATAKPDGSDLRFIAADGKTVLAHEIESYDSLLNEAFVWVRLPELAGGDQETLHLYYGNAAAGAPADAGKVHGEDSALVYHFAGVGTAPTDSTGNGNDATAPATTAEGSLIGNGLRLADGTPVEIPGSGSLAWRSGGSATVAFWIRPAAVQENAVVFSRGDAFRLTLDGGIPVVNAGGNSSAAGAPLAAGVWSHLAVVAAASEIKLYVNGAEYATLAGGLPAAEGALVLGGSGGTGFSGELDEFIVAGAERSAAWVKFAAINQGSDPAGQRALVVGGSEGGTTEAGGSHVMEHLSLFGDIARNMMFDGWIAIGVCAIMIVVGWTVAVKKFLYLNSIEKGSKLFLERWKNLSTDLTALDTGDQASVTSLGGTADASSQGLIHKSPLFHIYQIGAEEIRHRLDHGGARDNGLNGRSIQAIRASLDAGLVHESHRLSDGLVYLTISIAGGPYVGLLGTVVGVMITFAIIAKSGEVNVNSIAPGIASALLATVVGLIVAIPALFIYSYLNGRIKNALGLMQVFIDEFVAKMAEFHRPAGESDYTGGSGH